MNKIERLYLQLYPFIFKVLRKLRLSTTFINERKHQIIKSYIRKNYGEILSPYKQYKSWQEEILRDTDPIWVFWLQGEDNMPEIVRICLRRLQQTRAQHPIHLLTRENYHQFVKEKDWDKAIERSCNEGTICIAHFSDLLRTHLLYHHGGIWIDATVLFGGVHSLDDLIDGQVFYSGRRINVTDNYNPPQGKWTSYFVASAKGNPLFKLIHDFLVAHLHKEGRFIEYFMLDYIFTVAYEDLPFVQEMVDKVPPTPNKLIALMGVLNDRYTETKWRELYTAVPFHKLTYKQPWKEITETGEMTMYGFLKNEFAQNGHSVL